MARSSWKIDPENERVIIPEENEEGAEIPLPTTTEMANPAMWVHGTPNILGNCRTAHFEQEEAPADWDQDKDWDAEAYMKGVEKADPYEPLLKPITADVKVCLSETITQNAWTCRLMGDSEEYKHDEIDGPQLVPTKSNGVVVVRSLIWPGSLSFYFQGRIIQLYVGNTHKWEYGKAFFPVETPVIESDPDEYDCGPEPNPKDAPQVEKAAEEGNGEEVENKSEVSEY